MLSTEPYLALSMLGSLALLTPHWCPGAQAMLARQVGGQWARLWPTELGCLHGSLAHWLLCARFWRPRTRSQGGSSSAPVESTWLR